MDRDSDNELPLPSALELQRLVKLEEAARLGSTSIDFLEDHHADKIIYLSPRMRRMRVGDALHIGKQPKST